MEADTTSDRGGILAATLGGAVPTKPTGSMGLLVPAALAAIELLKNPKVQDQLAEAAAATAGGVRELGERHATRKAERVAASSEPRRQRRSPSEVVTKPFGQQKMQRRVANLSENVNLLRGSVGPEAEAALTEVDTVVNRLAIAVEMAGNLPMGKRLQARRELDSVLDKLERAVFQFSIE